MLVGVRQRSARAATRRVAVALVLGASSLVALPGSAGAVVGSTVAWGDNSLAQLGDGTTVSHVVPAPTTAPSDVTAIEGGRGHVLALRSDGTVWAWGSNDMGQIGDGTLVDRSTAVPVSGLSGVVRVAAGHYHSLALRSDGTVWAWGFNSLGQLGDGTTTNRRAPVRVSGISQVVDIAGGRDMSYALLADGTVWGWGQNTLGQLGDGTTTNRRTPVRVGTLSNVVRIAAGRDHGLAVLADGTVRSWGSNEYGQLGDGTTTNRLTPVVVPGLGQVVDVTAGAFHSVALRSDGTVGAWGRNNLGQLGDGTLVQRRSPVSVAGLAGVVAIGSGRDHAYAALADGSARAWGQNDFGQLGDGTTTNRTRPVPVSGLFGVVEIGGGRDYGVALVATSPDVEPPTTPGTPAGSSPASDSVSIAWTPSSDASPITYRVFRDGGASPVGSTSATSFVDRGLVPGSVHTYTVRAVDAAGNESAMSGVSDPIVVLTGTAPIFADDFASGGFGSWTGVTRLTVDGGSGGVAPPSARAQVSGQSAWAYRRLSSTYGSMCMSAAVNVAALGGAVDLLRLRTATDGPVSRVYVSAAGVLFVRADASGAQLNSGVSIGSGWHAIELCGTVGTSGTWSLYRDGVRIVSGWVANTGTTPVGRVQIGDTAAKTFTVNFDDVIVDQTPG